MQKLILRELELISKRREFDHQRYETDDNDKLNYLNRCISEIDVEINSIRLELTNRSKQNAYK